MAGALAGVLSGGETDPIEVVGEKELLALERSEFSQLVCQAGTLDRIESMLLTGKPLRN